MPIYCFFTHALSYSDTLTALQNPAARLLVVNPDYEDEYQALLAESKGS